MWDSRAAFSLKRPGQPLKTFEDITNRPKNLLLWKIIVFGGTNLTDIGGLVTVVLAGTTAAWLG